MKYAFKKLKYRILAPLFDITGSIVFFPVKLFQKAPPSNPAKILVVRLDHIGDFVCTTPVFRNLKRKFPDAKITVLVNSASKELAYRDPDIDKVITFSPFYLKRGDGSSSFKALMRIVRDIKNIGFDLGVEPRGDLLSIAVMWLGRVKYRVGYGITGGGFLLHREGRYDKNTHVIDRNLSLLKDMGISAEDKTPAVYFNEKDEDEVERLLRPLHGDGIVVIHPFAGAKAKEWSRENFQKVIEYLKNSGRDVILVGSKDDNGLFRGVNDLRGKLTLPQLACLIKKTGSFIGLDSGPANIAAALNVPSVIICSGTNVPQLWLPNSPNARFIYKDVGCKPCGMKVCPKVRHECMDQITPEEVFDKFKEIHEGLF